MANYIVKMRFSENEKDAITDVPVAAGSLSTSPDWILFYIGRDLHAHTVVAAFPKENVISVIATD